MSDGFNGPSQETYFEHVARALDIQFQIWRWMAKAGHNMDAYEKKGGDREDIRDGLALGKMSQEARLAEVNRKARVLGYHGIVVTVQANGQGSFADTFDAPPDVPGAGGFPLGSAASIQIVMVDGWRSGKAGHLGLADNPWSYETQEATAWAEGFGMGMEDRPPPKPRKQAQDGANGEAEPEGEYSEETVHEAPKRKRGRPRKSSGERMVARLQSMAERPRALPAPDPDAPGWHGDRDFHQDLPPPVV